MFFATDITNFLACQHIAALNREEAEGKITKTFYADPGNELLKRLGLEHEQKYWETEGLKVVEIPTDILSFEAAAATKEAMAQGAEAIYQATFLCGEDTFLKGTSEVPSASDLARGGRDARGPSEEVEWSTWGGRADFLLRVETGSEIGPWLLKEALPGAKVGTVDKFQGHHRDESRRT
jgi:uncharacterized protein